MAKYNHNVSPTWISLKQRGNYLFGFGVRSSHVPVPIRVLYNFGYIIYNIYIYIRICLFSSICRYIVFIYIYIYIYINHQSLCRHPDYTRVKWSLLNYWVPGRRSKMLHTTIVSSAKEINKESDFFCLISSISPTSFLPRSAWLFSFSVIFQANTEWPKYQWLPNIPQHG